MTDNTDVRGQQRYTNGGDARVVIGADQNKNLLVSSGLPPYTEVSRLGEGWTVGTSTLFAPIVAYPSTAAALEVYNNSTTRALIVSDFYAAQILSTAATQTYSIFAMVTTQKAIPTLTALSLFSTSGKAIVTPTAAGEVVTGVGTTVIANGWRPWGSVQSWGTAAATPGNAWSVDVGGKLVVPPGASVCMHIVGSLATASTFQCGMTFYLNPLTVEA